MNQNTRAKPPRIVDKTADGTAQRGSPAGAGPGLMPEAEVREMMSEAERQAAQATYHALEEASVQWEHKKEEARQRIPQAARWIVEKVVER